MPKLTFRGAYIRYMDVRQEEGGLLARLHMSSDFSAPVCRAMEWPAQLDPTVGSAKLDGELVLNNFILTPNGGEELKRYEIDIAARDATAFQVKRVEDDNGGTHTRLDFVVRVGGAKAVMQLSNYMDKIGQSGGVLKIDCAKQEELDLDAAPDPGAEEPELEEFAEA